MRRAGAAWLVRSGRDDGLQPSNRLGCLRRGGVAACGSRRARPSMLGADGAAFGSAALACPAITASSRCSLAVALAIAAAIAVVGGSAR